MTVAFQKLGNMGRLGNQMFQIASTIGISFKNLGAPCYFPEWNYSKYFEGETFFNTSISEITALEHSILKEPEFNFNEVTLSAPHTDLLGYYQTEKYWQESKNFIKNIFKFKPEFIRQAKTGLEPAFEKETIAIHIRRGDYTQEPYKNIYYQLPITWFIKALFTIENWQGKNIILFSDDIAFCKFHFGCLPNVYFSEGKSDIEDMCLMSQCGEHIISNSTFAWWGAYLSGQKNVIHSGQLFIGDFADKDISDFYPENWTKYWPENNTLDLTDLTITIPVFADHKDRKQNLDLCVCVLQNSFNTNIIIGEQGSNRFQYMEQWCSYIKFHYPKFHRTKMLNEMAKASNTPFIANWDCDVVIAPLQIYMTVVSLRNGNAMVFPYDGRFARLPRQPWFKMLEMNIDLSPLKDAPILGSRGKPVPITSVGGAVFFNKEKFIEAGMENEHMISFGPEDCERNDRFTALGYKIDRVKGPLFHIDHYCGPDSSTKNPHFRENHVELEKIRHMKPQELREYVKTWPWIKKQVTPERVYKIKAVVQIDDKEITLYDDEINDSISLAYKQKYISNSVKTVLHITN